MKIVDKNDFSATQNLGFILITLHLKNNNGVFNNFYRKTLRFLVKDFFLIWTLKKFVLGRCFINIKFVEN